MLEDVINAKPLALEEGEVWSDLLARLPGGKVAKASKARVVSLF